MVAIILDDKYCIINKNSQSDPYDTIVFSKGDVIDGQFHDFTEAWEDSYEAAEEEDYYEIMLNNFTWSKVQNVEEAYKWIIRKSFNAS